MSKEEDKSFWNCRCYKTAENLFGHYFVPILGLVSAKKKQFSDAEKSQEKLKIGSGKGQEFGIWKSGGHPAQALLLRVSQPYLTLEKEVKKMGETHKGITKAT